MRKWEEARILLMEKQSVRVPLVCAQLCLDCEVIYTGPRCPACGSKEFFSVASAIPTTQHPAALGGANSEPRIHGEDEGQVLVDIQ